MDKDKIVVTTESYTMMANRVDELILENTQLKKEVFMGQDVRTIKELTAIYDSLIKLAASNLGKNVKVEWGVWTPTERGLKTLLSRRAKLNKGV